MVKVIVKRNVEERGLGIFNREAKWRLNAEYIYLPLERMDPGENPW